MTDLNDPQAVASTCAECLWQDDRTSQKLGMKIVRVAPGEAELSMTVTEDMVNGHNIGHGGYLFTLADSTFAFACNTYNQRCVAQHCSISFLAPVHAGEQLRSVAKEVSRQGRNGIYDITVFDSQSKAIVEFRGYSRTIKGAVLPDTH